MEQRLRASRLRTIRNSINTQGQVPRTAKGNVLPKCTQKLCLLHPQLPAPRRLAPETRYIWPERNKPYMGSAQTAGCLQGLPSRPCDGFCQRSAANCQGGHSEHSICSNSSSFCTLLCSKGIVRILSPFLCIKESFCKWIVFNFKSCDLKNKKLRLLVRCSFTRGFNWAPRNQGPPAPPLNIRI